MPLSNHLHIIAGYKNGNTFLKHSFGTQPFKLANITEDANSKLLRLMVTSSSPGILDNDNYSIKIEIEAHAKMLLTTQGYQRIFAMANKAGQSVNVQVGEHASFYFLPHPTVPHNLSNFSSVNNIYLKKSHRLLWSDIITCGRKLSGEEFTFTRYQNTTNIYLENKLVVKEIILLEPLKKNVHSLGQLEGYTHQSTLLFIDNQADMKQIADACNEMLPRTGEITFGISMLPVNGLILRVLGHKGEQLFDYNNRLAAVIQQVGKQVAG